MRCAEIFRGLGNATVALAVASLLSTNASAAFAEYRLTFTVTNDVTEGRICYRDVETYSCDESAIGLVYHGSFSVDDEVLATDGLNKPGTVGYFLITMEDNTWAFNAPGDNSFVGFRGPGPSSLFAPSPGFDVLNGQVVNLRGGVFGLGDRPFVDFTSLYSPTEPNRFAAGGYPIVFNEPFRWLEATGTLDIAPIPVPQAVWLFGSALGVMGWVRRKPIERYNREN
jgi:hypothetical protein